MLSISLDPVVLFELIYQVNFKLKTHPRSSQISLVAILISFHWPPVLISCVFICILTASYYINVSYFSMIDNVRRPVLHIYTKLVLLVIFLEINSVSQISNLFVKEQIMVPDWKLGGWGHSWHHGLSLYAILELYAEFQLYSMIRSASKSYPWVGVGGWVGGGWFVLNINISLSRSIHSHCKKLVVIREQYSFIVWPLYKN